MKTIQFPKAPGIFQQPGLGAQSTKVAGDKRGKGTSVFWAPCWLL